MHFFVYCLKLDLLNNYILPNDEEFISWNNMTARKIKIIMEWTFQIIKGAKFLKKTLVLRRWGFLQDNEFYEV